MTSSVEVLHLAVVGPLVGHVERRRDRASIGIGPTLLEQVGVQALVQVVDGIIEGQQDDLRYLLRQVVSYFVVIVVVVVVIVVVVVVRAFIHRACVYVYTSMCMCDMQLKRRVAVNVCTSVRIVTFVRVRA